MLKIEDFKLQLAKIGKCGLDYKSFLNESRLIFCKT